MPYLDQEYKIISNTFQSMTTWLKGDDHFKTSPQSDVYKPGAYLSSSFQILRKNYNQHVHKKWKVASHKKFQLYKVGLTQEHY